MLVPIAQEIAHRAVWPPSITNTYAQSLHKVSVYCSSNARCRRHTSMIVPNVVPCRRTCATKASTQRGTLAIQAGSTQVGLLHTAAATDVGESLTSDSE
jgi:hypothetical protein